MIFHRTPEYAELGGTLSIIEPNSCFPQNPSGNPKEGENTPKICGTQPRPSHSPVTQNKCPATRVKVKKTFILNRLRQFQGVWRG